MRRSFILSALCLAFLTALWPVPQASADSAFSVQAKLTFLGNLGPDGEQRYRYDYTVTNNEIPPMLGAFQVFFNSDPVTQLPTGDRATYVSYGAPPGWEAVTVLPKNEAGQWGVVWDWDYADSIQTAVPGQSLAGFSVMFDWNDPNSIPPVQLTQVRNGSAHDGVIEVPPASIVGVVIGDCGAPVGLQGITVDLFLTEADSSQTLIASTATNASGQFTFANLGIGNYEVVIVTPLGYLADANSKPVLVNETGLIFNVNFALTCQTITAQPRTIGYWKHQVNCYLTGKGQPQETLSAMSSYVDDILVHFNQNITNPVIIFVPDDDGLLNLDKELRKLDQLLTVNKGGTMLDRAKQQMVALLLNVVSGKIAQTQVISSNGATVSQAITYCNDLIQDGNPANDETAKTIADMINNGQMVPSGMIPIGTRVITYRNRPAGDEGVEFRLDAAAPNPSRGGLVSIGFALGRADRVDLRLFDVSGRMVKTLASGSFNAGPHRFTWDGTSDSGARVQPGVYFYRLVTEEGTLTRSVTLQR